MCSAEQMQVICAKCYVRYNDVPAFWLLMAFQAGLARPALVAQRRKEGAARVPARCYRLGKYRVVRQAWGSDNPPMTERVNGPQTSTLYCMQCFPMSEYNVRLRCVASTSTLQK